MLDKLDDGMTERLQPFGLSPPMPNIEQLGVSCSGNQPVQTQWLWHVSLGGFSLLTVAL